MERIAVFPGSFDPVTVGHELLIRRALPLFDRIIVGVGENGEKRTWFTVAERLSFLRELFADEPKVEVASYAGLTTDFCRERGARYMLRGLRTAADFEYEKTIASVNRRLCADVESVFLCAEDGVSFVQSSVVRDLLRHGRPVAGMVTDAIADAVWRLALEKR
ncbi:MAG: pantetheine-phosphate adenylyltransferase [Bacteroidales bacterium]|nr:pantetheine-phosphate adenylyltransferase [Bacteroidales bacterium]